MSTLLSRQYVGMEKPTSFRDWLKSAMDELGYTKSSLSRETGIDRAHLRRIENGQIEKPETETREKLHKAFGTSDDDLERMGILIRREYPRPDGSVHVEYELTAPAVEDIGERAAIVAMLDRMPDDAVQHLRQFLEAVAK